MYDTTNITVVGNALNTPEWRRFERTNALVANFKIASTSRRFDKQNNRWIDGDNLRVRVNCWRRLAEGVVASVKVGDPVVVTGRLFTRDWTTEDGQRRSTYELEAVTVGHDLSRGVAAFRRGRINVNTTVVEDAETDRHVKGELTEAAPEENARSEAVAASLGEEFRVTNGTEFPHTGFDGPVNSGRVSLDDLKDVVADEMGPDLARAIATAQQKLGTTTLDPGPADGGVDGGDGVDDGLDDQAAVLNASAGLSDSLVPTPPPVRAEAAGRIERTGDAAEPARNRRGRSRVGASA
jgi:single-strand DNA-binding protein